ncbi:pentapeptide repeat-containing protein [Roseibium polysiphoniae]|uniref:Pentapeptide repeat-containing protein n=1 Tax=Roseibium polysiphoniae TaxID=2571221 RepID=A0ABR9C6C8_9HYPH|nr:pentapeptide repeat-containing protein [Roseibium polysiphoniae]MBD8875442.1 pentapeptide repeat-containing protein [Roseibium polysiphoniae]
MSISEKIRNNKFVKVLAALEPIGVAVGLIGLGIAGYAFFQDLESRKEERIARAWDLLSIQIPGNSGKSDALRILHGYEINLSDVDLSCGFLGGTLQDKGYTVSHIAITDDQSEFVRSPCVGSPRLNNLELGEIAPSWRNLWSGQQPLIAENINLEGISGEDLDLSGASIGGGNFSYTNIVGLDLNNAIALDLSAEYSNLDHSDFSFAELSGADFSRAGLSHSKFEGATAVCADFAGANLEAVDLQSVEDFEGSSLFMARLENSKISNDIALDNDLSFANVSGAHFAGNVAPRENLFGPMWAWSDNPPKPAGVAQKMGVRLCEPSKEDVHDDRETYLLSFGTFRPINWELVPQHCGLAPEFNSDEYLALAAPTVCVE